MTTFCLHYFRACRGNAKWVRSYREHQMLLHLSFRWGREEEKEERGKSSIRMISPTVTTTTQLAFFREEVRFRLKMWLKVDEMDNSMEHNEDVFAKSSIMTTGTWDRFVRWRDNCNQPAVWKIGAGGRNNRKIICNVICKQRSHLPTKRTSQNKWNDVFIYTHICCVYVGRQEQ